MALLLLPFPLVRSERRASGDFTEKPAGGRFMPLGGPRGACGGVR
ncbi:hypothetical protein ACGFOM_38265 [Streptomyces sp. NPDC048594]